MAKVKVQSEFMGKGCFIQLLAVGIALFGFALGPVVGIAGLVIAAALFFYGSDMSQSWVCSECRNIVASNKVRICPTCKAQLNN